jgi:predicted ArsR family transcriptional regulator
MSSELFLNVLDEAAPTADSRGTMSQDNAERILFLLKTRGPLTAAALAKALRITPMGVRQHLARLVDDGLVTHVDERIGVGRPKRHWRLTEKAEARFPDSHAQMTVELLTAVRSVFGAAGLDRLIAERERETLARYKQAMRGARTVEDRAKKLARLRNEEGYMAECAPVPDGSILLVENHCPVCAAARSCQGLCRSELDIFRALFPGVSVDRVDHILVGARRCAYRIDAARASKARSSR